jgi:copper chaperone CopZ
VAGEVEVTFDPGQTDLDAIRAAVRDAGFTPA